MARVLSPDHQECGGDSPLMQPSALPMFPSHFLSHGPHSPQELISLCLPFPISRCRSRAPDFQGCLQGPLLSSALPSTRNRAPLCLRLPRQLQGGWNKERAVPCSPWRAPFTPRTSFTLCILLLVHSAIWQIPDCVLPARPWAVYSEKFKEQK